MLTLKFPASLIGKVKSGEIVDVFIDKTDDNRDNLFNIGILDERGSVLNRKEWLRLIAWEDDNCYVDIYVSVKLKPGRSDCGKDEDTLYYVLRIHDVK